MNTIFDKYIVAFDYAQAKRTQQLLKDYLESDMLKMTINDALDLRYIINQLQEIIDTEETRYV